MTDGPPLTWWDWVRVDLGSEPETFHCTRCGTTREIHADDDRELVREGHDFLIRHRGCPARRALQ
jgi:hypothetical protein